MTRIGSETFDAIIIGAGITGLNTASRIQSSFPGYKYAILESRTSLGGTWDLFRYPGVRSDSDMRQYAFAWRPWTSDVSIASGSDILNYLKDSAAATGIDQKILYSHRLISANWSTENAHWHLTVDTPDSQRHIYTRWLLICTGYCSYTNTADSRIPGIGDFAGKIVHPQFWPQDYDYTNKNIAIIGSGATAVKLVPELAKRAAKVTMLQRSPTYIVSQPRINPIAATLNRYLPTWLAWQLARWWGLFINYTVVTQCKKNPAKWTGLLKAAMKKELPSRIPVDPHFTPKYRPWQQRLCVAADGDFFEALRSGKADVVTDTIANVTNSGIELASGESLEVDDIVTANGFRLHIGGGVELSVDGEKIQIGGTLLWRNLMLKDVPNLGFFIGYGDQTWTWGVDVNAKMLCRVLKMMQDKNVKTAVPRMTEQEMKGTEKVELLDLTSGYLVRGVNQLPVGGNRQPWKPKMLYLWDWWAVRWTNVEEGLELVD